MEAECPKSISLVLVKSPLDASWWVASSPPIHGTEGHRVIQKVREKDRARPGLLIYKTSHKY